MNKKLFCIALAIVIAGTIFVSAYMASATPKQGNGSDRILSKRTFIHFRKGSGKPPWAGGGNGGGKKEEEGYYTYLAKGAKWRTTEPYLLNPENEDFVEADDIFYAVSSGMQEWEAPEGSDIFGGLLIDDSAEYAGGAYRGCNTISFGHYGNQDVIAVASVWGYFSGPPSQREIVEAHILFNDDFEWGIVDNPDNLFMDVQNIVTHELGHCAGMGDLYEPAALEETMYGYSSEGETKKRDLYIGDIEGITKLYR